MSRERPAVIGSLPGQRRDHSVEIHKASDSVDVCLYFTQIINKQLDSHQIQENQNQNQNQKVSTEC